MIKYSDDADKRRYAVAKRMLETPRKPHAPLKGKAPKRSTGKGRARVGKSRS